VLQETGELFWGADRVWLLRERLFGEDLTPNPPRTVSVVARAIKVNSAQLTNPSARNRSLAYKIV